MGFDGVKVNKLNGGLGRSNPNTDRIVLVALPVAAAKLPAGLVHYQPHELLQASDANALGITAAFDANELVLFNQQIGEFFRLAPDGVIYIVAVPDTLTVTQLVAVEAFKAAIRVASDVKGIAIAIPADVTATAAHAEAVQAFVSGFVTEHRLIDFVVLPAKGNAVTGTIADYPDLRTKNAPIVSVSIAQDPAVAAIDPAYAKYADWGSVLGMLAVRKINENLGSVNIINKPSARKGDPDYTLTDSTHWLDAALSSGIKVSTLSPADKNALTAKGYIYAGGYDGYGGVFFNSSPTCVQLSSDYAYIENNCVWNKAARQIRLALLPEVKGVVKKNPTTGYIKTTTISRWSGLASGALERMQNADEISGFEVYIDPKQVLSESSPVKVKATVVADDIAHSFEVDLGLASKI